MCLRWMLTFKRLQNDDSKENEIKKWWKGSITKCLSTLWDDHEIFSYFHSPHDQQLMKMREKMKKFNFRRREEKFWKLWNSINKSQCDDDMFIESRFELTFATVYQTETTVSISQGFSNGWKNQKLYQFEAVNRIIHHHSTVYHHHHHWAMSSRLSLSFCK